MGYGFIRVRVPCPTSTVDPVHRQRRLTAPPQGVLQLLAQHLKRVQFSVQSASLLSTANDTDGSEQNHPFCVKPQLSTALQLLKQEFRKHLLALVLSYS